MENLLDGAHDESYDGSFESFLVKDMKNRLNNPSDEYREDRSKDQNQRLVFR